jgi:hypothetical protein
MKRNAYLLTCDVNSDRTQFSKNILKEIGFNVIFFEAIPHSNPLLSHRKSMMEIFRIIANDVDNDWSYIFEDDINKLIDIKLDEIVKYETISNKFFYLGICKYGLNTIIKTKHIINGHKVYSVSGYVRGAHAFAFSRLGMIHFLNFASKFLSPYIDIILELYTRFNPTNVVRVDLQSYIRGHLGAIFQDRNKFKSIIGSKNTLLLRNSFN